MEVPIERDALVALLDRMLRAEAREDAPPKAERSEWMYGSVAGDRAGGENLYGCVARR